MLRPDVGCTDSSTSFSTPLPNISPRNASEAKERTISLGSVLWAGPLGCFCNSASWNQDCPSLGWISSRPMHASGRPSLHLSVQVVQMLAESFLAIQTTSFCKYPPYPTQHTRHCKHSWNKWPSHHTKPNQLTPQVRDFRQQLIVGKLGSHSDSW